MTQPKLTFIGGGNMASSLIGGLLEKGFTPDHITVSDPLAENRQRLQQTFGVTAVADNHSACANADVVILAVKPQVMQTVAEGIANSVGNSSLIISIAAGIPISALETWLGNQPAIVRCMPNTPALVQTGASGLFANARVTDQQRQQAEDILNAVGISCWLHEEADIDAVTAVSGSGPAYFFLIMEIMEKVGTELGLSSENARQLTLQTALGAAKMAMDSDVEAAELRRRVTSPGGTTQRAIETFQQGNLENLFKQAMQGAVTRAQEMADELTKK